MSDLLVARFERYFRHPHQSHEVLNTGDCAIACVNLRRALDMLGIPVESDPSDAQLFDKNLEAAVKCFQRTFHHRVSDGRVGPGTRQLIVSSLLTRYSPSIFLRLERPEADQIPSVFLSYAWLDTAKVNKLDQWLRDKGIRVIRDESSFQAGTSIPENIRRAVAEADKVLAIFSANSRDRDWPRLERAIAEDIEHRIGTAVLIYVCLDKTPLPAHDPTRLAIAANIPPLKEVGAKILHALTGDGLQPKRYEYNENEPL